MISGFHYFGKTTQYDNLQGSWTDSYSDLCQGCENPLLTTFLSLG